MAYKNQDFEMFAGDHKMLIFGVDNMASLIGSTVRWKVATLAGGTPIIEKESSDSSQIEVDGLTFSVKLLPEDTENLRPNKDYYHEAEIEDPSGYINTVAIGTMTLLPSTIDPS